MHQPSNIQDSAISINEHQISPPGRILAALKPHPYLSHFIQVASVRAVFVIGQRFRAYKLMEATRRSANVTLAGNLASEAGDRTCDLVDFGKHHDAGEFCVRVVRDVGMREEDAHRPCCGGNILVEFFDEDHGDGDVDYEAV